MTNRLQQRQKFDGRRLLGSTLTEFAILTSKSGSPYAVHCPSGMRLHSAVDPVAEARELAERIQIDERGIVLFGGGFGYLPEQLLSRTKADMRIHVIEPHPELVALVSNCRPNSEYLTSSRILRHSAPGWIATAEVLTIHPELPVIVAPYLSRIAHASRERVSGLLQWMRTRMASSQVYQSVLESESVTTSSMLAALPAPVPFTEKEFVAVIGAGPSLDACLPELKARRGQIELVAVSGACPALARAGINPDWVICLEALPGIVRDMESVPHGTKAIVFSSTHSEILRSPLLRRCTGEDAAMRLQTDGGTSLLPALDFALRMNAPKVIMIGAELSNRSGAYSKNVSRSVDDFASADRDPPKFVAMRYAVERLIKTMIHRDSSKILYHIRSSEIMPLSGTSPLLPEHLNELIGKNQLQTAHA